jgi:uncharacterized repeat protein (TIGR03803 family)
MTLKPATELGTMPLSWCVRSSISTEICGFGAASLSDFTGVISRLIIGSFLAVMTLGVSGLAVAASPIVLASSSSGAFAGIESPLVIGSNGSFYAASQTTSCCGQIIELTPAGAVSTLAPLTFANGDDPNSLILGSDGNFYGTATKGGSSSCTLWNQTADSGCGTLFRVSPAGVVTTVATFDFTTGAWPGFVGGTTGLVQGNDGNFYGTTFEGGTTDGSGPCYAQGCGTVFKVTSSGTQTALVSFDGTNGANPSGGLVVGTDGNFYGTTYTTVFKVTPTGTLTTLATLNGAQLNGLVAGPDGNFYVTSSVGGGAIYQVTSAGAVTIFDNFSTSSLSAPNSGSRPADPLFFASDGNFYGTTIVGGYYGFGTVFQMTPAGVVTTLFSFDNDILGGSPQATLIEGGDGNLYGATPSTFFKVCMDCPSPPQGLAVTNISNGSATLSWDAATGDQTYNVYVGAPGGAIPTTPTLTGITDTSTTVTGLNNLTEYNFYVAAVGTGGNSAYSNLAGATPLATSPAAPTLSVNVSDGIATLTWTVPQDVLSHQAAYSYNVYAASSSGAEGTTPQYTNLAANSITVGAGPNGAGTYYFEVTALNGNGESVVSNEVTAANLSTLAAPSSPIVSASGGPGTVALSWSATGTAATYSIFEGTSAGGEASAPIETGITDTSVTLAGLKNGTTYYFTVVAINSAGASAASTETSAKPMPAAPPLQLTATAHDGAVDLTWISSISGNVTYNVYQGGSPTTLGSTPTMTGIAATDVTVSGLTNGTTYYFTVTGIVNGAVATLSNGVFVTPVASSSSSTTINSSPGADHGGGGGGSLDPLILVALATLLASRRWGKATGREGSISYLRPHGRL